MRTILSFVAIMNCVVGVHASIGRLQPGQFERMLLPVTVRNLSGAYGSIWSTELWAFAQDTTTLRYEPLFPACDPPCEDWNDRNELYGIPSGNTYEAGILITKPGETPGQYLYLPTDNLGDIQFALRLHELTGIAQAIQLPVVRQSAFSGTVIRILGVPSRPFTRATLRVYGSDPDVPGLVKVRIHEEPRGDVVFEGTFAVVATQRVFTTSYGQMIPTKPPVAEIGAITATATTPTVWIEIVPQTPNLRVWAFVSVTDNRTQEVVLRVP